MSDVTEITAKMAELTVIPFRKMDDVKRLTKHLIYVLNRPETKKNPIVHKYLYNMYLKHRDIYTQPRELVEVEYILTTEKKSSVQRQRFNSLPVSEVPDLLKTEFASTENAQQVHICTDCDVEIELNDEIPLMESLQKHFNLEVHLPKLKRESIDVAEPIVLPNMSRRMSAMGTGDNSIELPQNLNKPKDKIDRMFSAKLEASLIRYLPDNSEANVDAAVKFYQTAFANLCAEVSSIDFSQLTGSVAPIIMSIKDNVNQNFATDANKTYENEENDPNLDRPKNQIKKYRYYGPIENDILKLLANHKLLTLADDRTGKPAFFCIACEYYTLRFKYDSVLKHVFSDTHIHNLSWILEADTHIPFVNTEKSVDKIREMNSKFLASHRICENNIYECQLCKINIDTQELAVVHVLDENHLGRMSDRMYMKAKRNNEGLQQDEWGPKSSDWVKFLSINCRALSFKDNLVIENFIKPSGKVANYCSCCDMTLKGPRQVLFNHIRQKKHLRNAAPLKLDMLYKNYCRPVEYYASFGNFFICTLCPKYVAFPSFAAVVEHFETSMHVESLAKLILSAVNPEKADAELLSAHKIVENKCLFCDVTFGNLTESVAHILSSAQHHNFVSEDKSNQNKGDLVSVYMNGNYVLHFNGAVFNCTPCSSIFKSLRSLLAHLVYAEHFAEKPSAENVFRFYLELKHNINLWGRNKYIYTNFGKLRCCVCELELLEAENAKKHVVSQRHRENMGASYVNVNLDGAACE